MLKQIPFSYRFKTHVLPNGVNFSLFRPIERLIAIEYLKLDPKNIYVLFLGDIDDPRKNFHLLEQAFLKIDRYYQTSETSSKIVLLTPYPIPPADVVYYLNACTVIVVTSLVEGSPNVIKEAMACNCPIVTVPVGDAPEIINNTSGCYLSSYDPEDLIKKIVCAIEYNGQTNGRTNIDYLRDSNTSLKVISLYKSLI